MKLKLKNVGKIKEADIELSGLTLIAGPNDSGKSTVGKVSFALVKSIANYPVLFNQIQIEKLYKEYLNPLRLELRELSNSVSFHSSSLFRTDEILEKKPKLLKAIRALYGHFEFSMDISHIKSLLKDILNNSNDLENKENIQNSVNSTINFLSHNNSSTEKIQLISNRIFQDVFESNINNSAYRNDNASIIFENNDINIISLNSNNDNIICDSFSENFPIFSDATLIDNPFLLEDNYNLYGEYRNRFIPMMLKPMETKIIDSSTDLVEKEKTAAKRLNKENYHENLLKEFENIFNSAQFKNSSNDGRLKYKVNSKAKELEISNIASGCKSFGILYILLKTGVITKDSLIILDEPENHLHPEWQIKYAEIICKMVKNGFYVLLTSHSPYMIQALRTYSEREEIFDKKVNFYFASKDKNGKNYSIIENVKNEDGIFDDSRIFQSLYSPIETLDEIYSEINLKVGASL